MRFRRLVVAGAIPVVCLGVSAQQMQQASVVTQQSQAAAPAGTSRPLRTAYYVDPTMLDVSDLIQSFPAIDSAEGRAEMVDLHRIEKTRTEAEVAQAKADDAEEDMFAFKTVLGPAFSPEAFPITAGLGVHVKNEQSVIGNQLKQHFERMRPYQVDETLHAVCPVKPAHDSYPSGHALTGYLEALTLAEMVPEKRAEILARADDYAHNRLVCGVHYASDIEASRRIAYIVFGYMLATPRFQHDLAAAKLELRPKLGFPQK